MNLKQAVALCLAVPVGFALFIAGLSLMLSGMSDLDYHLHEHDTWLRLCGGAGLVGLALALFTILFALLERLDDHEETA
jgi:hypothetical protein